MERYSKFLTTPAVLATLSAKFNAITGHKHTGAADDAPNIAGTSVTNTPAGTIAAATVQAAINELDTEKETPAAAQSKVDTHAALMVNQAVHPIPVTTKTTTYLALSTDSILLADAVLAAFIITLPTAVGITGKVYNIKKIDGSANAVTINGDGIETIDGDLTMIVGYQNDSITIISDGTNWRII